MVQIVRKRRKFLRGSGAADMLISLLKNVAPHLLPAASKILEGVAGGVGSRLQKLISGDGMKLAGSGAQLAGMGRAPANYSGIDAGNELHMSRQSGSGIFLAGQVRRKKKY